MWSHQKPSQDLPEEGDAEQPDKKRRRTTESAEGDESNIANYFPASCEHMFGPLPIPPDTSNDRRFPHNVVFQTADWVTSEIAEDTQGYDVVVA